MHFNPSIRQLSRRVAALAAALWCCVMPVLHADAPAAEYTACGMLDKHIALAPSHGMYYNSEQQLWRWQRATMWTTVEDVYTTEYVKQIATMIENAGGTVYQPRPRLNGQDYVIRNGQGVFVPCGGAYEKGRSGLPRWAECAREWLEHAGYPDSIYDVYQGQNDYRADMMSRGRWVNYLRYDLGVPIDAFLALHTDGISDKANEAVIGSLAIYYTTGEGDPRALAETALESYVTFYDEFVPGEIIEDALAGQDCLHFDYTCAYPDRSGTNMVYEQTAIAYVPLDEAQFIACIISLAFDDPAGYCDDLTDRLTQALSAIDVNP